MVEKHIDGRDYRIVVFQGEAIFAIERVLLSNKANIGAGGTPISVMDRIHLDNLVLADRAVRALRLDLAGVDLLMEDIAISWKECECGICEINAQPQLGSITSSHLYPLILNRLVPDQGRNPVHIVVGNPEVTRPVLQSLMERYNNRNKTVGCYSEGTVTIDGDRVGMDMNAYQAGKLLIMDSSMDVIIMQVNDPSLSRSGLPFDQFSSLIPCSLDNLECVDGDSARPAEIEEFIDAISPAADKIIYCGNGTITPRKNWVQASQQEIAGLSSL